MSWSIACVLIVALLVLGTVGVVAMRTYQGKDRERW